MSEIIKCIIFDFDGVITQSVDIKTRAFAHLFREYPDAVIGEIVRYHLENGGKSRYVKFRHIHENIIKKPYDPVTEERLAEEFSRFVFDEVVKCPYIPGAIEFIEKNHDRYAFFIVSGTPDEEIKLIAEKRGISRYFRGIFGTPNKKGYWTARILEENGFSRENTAFIGDSFDDYRGAADNGCHFIGVLSGEFNPFEKLEGISLISDLTELETAILKIK